MKRKKFELIVDDSDGEDDVAYLMLPDHPRVDKEGVVNRTESLRDFVKDYRGPDIYLDFDKEGRLIGIELLD